MSKPYVVLLVLSDDDPTDGDPFSVATWLQGLTCVKDVTVWPSKTFDAGLIYDTAYDVLVDCSEQDEIDEWKVRMEDGNENF